MIRNLLRGLFLTVGQVLLLLGVVSHPAESHSFSGLGDLEGGIFFSRGYAVSADGSSVVGQGHSGSSEAFLWRDGVMMGLGRPEGAYSTVARGVSGDGAVVVGQFDILDETHSNAFRWEDGEMVPILDRAIAYTVSDDGSVIAGSISIEGVPGVSGFTWEGGDLTVLPHIDPEAARSFAYGISTDGSVVVGSSDFEGNPGGSNITRAARWEGGAVESLPFYDGGETDDSIAFDVSDDGSVVVGTSGGAAVRWVNGVVEPLGVLFGGVRADARAVSGDGSVIVGYEGAHATIWTEETGIRVLQEYILTEFGVETPGWRLSVADGISQDGRVIAGHGQSSNGAEAWRFAVEEEQQDLVVNVSTDDPDADSSDGRCDTDLDEAGDQCSLRAALEEAEQREGVDVIGFALPEGDEVIQIMSPLDPILEGIDLRAEPRADSSRAVLIDGGGLAADGLVFDGGLSHLRGVAIGGFGGAAVVLSGAGGHTVDACYIGLDLAGTSALPNGAGVFVDAPNASIGSGDPNVISGHLHAAGVSGSGSVPAELVGTGVIVSGAAASGSRVQRNTMGLSAPGTDAIPNSMGIAVVDAPNVRIGGAGAGNIISGCEIPAGSESPETVADLRGIGVRVTGGASSGAIIEANWLGLAQDGQTPIPNRIGVLVEGTPDVRVGGDSGSVDGNVIAGNPGLGLLRGEEDTPLEALFYGSGIALAGEEAGSAFVDGNFIGLTSDLTRAVPVRIGVSAVGTTGLLVGGSNGNTIVADHVGISVTALPGTSSPSGITITGNLLGLLPSGDLPGLLSSPHAAVLVHRAVDTVVGGNDSGNTISGWDTGVRVIGDGEGGAVGTRILGNLIGTDPSGTQSRPNTTGAWIAGAVANTAVGGWNPGDRNVISGNRYGVAVTTGDGEESVGEPTGTIIAGNFIGTDEDGTVALGNEDVGIFVGPHGVLTGDPGVVGMVTDVIIGATSEMAPGVPAERRRNVVAASGYAQILIDANLSQGDLPSERDPRSEQGSEPVPVMGNYIGVLADGSGRVTLSTLPTAPRFGVAVRGDARARIGMEDEGNLIGANAVGIWLDSDENAVTSNRIGVDVGGTESRANYWGVFVNGSRNTIGFAVGEGGDEPGPNVISGNGFLDPSGAEANDGAGVVISDLDVLNFNLPPAASGRNHATGAPSVLSRADRTRAGVPFPLPLGFAAPVQAGESRSSWSHLDGIRTMASRGDASAEANAIAYNLIGLTAGGDAAVVETGDVLGTIGVGVLSSAVGTRIYANRIGGVGGGIVIQQPNPTGGWTGPNPTGTLVAGNHLGIQLEATGGGPVGSVPAFIPVKQLGLVLFGARNSVIGAEAVPGFGPNVIAGTGREGSALPPPQRAPGVFLLHPEDATEHYPAGTNRLTQNLIHDNEGLGITRDPEELGVTPNGEGNNDGVASFNFPRILEVIEEGGQLKVSGTVSAEMMVEVFANPKCDDSGYGEGRFFLGRFQAFPGQDFVGFVDLPPASGWYISLTGTNVNDTTSEFSPCQQVISPVLAQGDRAQSDKKRGEKNTGELEEPPSGALDAGSETDRDGDLESTQEMSPDELSTPSSFGMSAFSPNPFHSETHLRLAMPSAGEVSVAVFDGRGRRVHVVHEGWLAAGRHWLLLDALELKAAGVYFVRATGLGASQVKRVTLLR